MKHVEKVLAYIVRHRDVMDEVLVFEHQDNSEAGIQVLAGTIGSNEIPEIAAIREVKEESGVDLGQSFKSTRLIGVFEYFSSDRNEIHSRHVFQFPAPDNLPNSWKHIVTAGDEDKNLVFNFYWLPIKEAIHKLEIDQGKYLTSLL